VAIPLAPPLRLAHVNPVGRAITGARLSDPQLLPSPTFGSRIPARFPPRHGAATTAWQPHDRIAGKGGSPEFGIGRIKQADGRLTPTQPRWCFARWVGIGVLCLFCPAVGLGGSGDFADGRNLGAKCLLTPEEGPPDDIMWCAKAHSAKRHRTCVRLFVRFARQWRASPRSSTAHPPTLSQSYAQANTSHNRSQRSSGPSFTQSMRNPA
jgi:hypothetical protein